jgi:hypothetical protein
VTEEKPGKDVVSNGAGVSRSETGPAHPEKLRPVLVRLKAEHARRETDRATHAVEEEGSGEGFATLRTLCGTELIRSQVDFGASPFGMPCQSCVAAGGFLALLFGGDDSRRAPVEDAFGRGRWSDRPLGE